jgi:hypothetical protein
MTIDQVRDWTSSAFVGAIAAVQAEDYWTLVPWGEAVLVLVLFVLWRRASRRAENFGFANENLLAELDATAASLDSEIAWRQAAERFGVQRPKELSEIQPPQAQADGEGPTPDVGVRSGQAVDGA